MSFVSSSVIAIPVIDDTPTRVQTTLRVDMAPVGTLRPKSVGEVSASRWTIDCAGMDREHCDWRAIREYVAPLGIPRMRQQAGWARCEKDPGKYDFAWLDQCVYDAKRMGVKVWMELSYGNPIYPGGGGRNLAAGIPKSKEGLEAWDRWVTKMVEHYAGIVEDWCIWNEPDLRGANEIGPLTDFAIRTAEIVKARIPNAKIAAFALTYANPAYIEPFVKELKERGKVELFTSIAYHHYSKNPDDKYENVEKSRVIIAEYAPNLKLMQGEGGTWSEWGAAGALKKMFWTELTQAKYDLRRSLGDLGHGDDTEVFHICDLEYRVSGFHDGLVRYGLIKTTGQADGYRILKVKMAYYAIQNAVSVFNDRLECLDHRTTSVISGLKRGVVYDWRDRLSGVKVVVFWDAEAMPMDDNVIKSVDIRIDQAGISNPVWCDVLTGDVYEIPAENVTKDGSAQVFRVPAYDSPTFITDRSILAVEKSWYVRCLENQSLVK